MCVCVICGHAQKSIDEGHGYISLHQFRLALNIYYPSMLECLFVCKRTIDNKTINK